MKTSFTRYALYLLLLCLCSCAKEDEFPLNNPYPILTTTRATPGSTGTEVEGEIVSLGKTPITEYGFTYTTSSSSTTIKKVVGTTPQKGTFNATLTANMVKGVRYDVQAYAITNGKTVYGNKVTFSSTSSAAPVIHDFNPKAGLDGTFITITGESFSLNKDEIRVMIGDVQAQVVSASIDSIQVQSPTVEFTGSFPITVTVLDKQVVSEKKYTILGPHITHLSANKGRPGEELTIYGNYFSYTRWGPFVTIGGKAAEIVSLTETEIKVIVPVGTSEIYDRELTVSISDWNKPVILPYSFIIESGFGTASVVPSDAGAALQDMPSFTANGKAYFFSSDHLLSYEMASNAWRNEGTFPGHPRNNSILYEVNGKAYLIGGNYQYYTLFRDIWEYDYNTNNWQKKTSLPFGVSDASSFTLDGKIYFFGGRNTSSRSTLWRYNPETEELVALNSFREDYNSSGFTSHGKAYMVLGKTTWLYNSQQDTWSQLASLPDEGAWQRQHRAFTYKGTGYAIDPRNDRGLYRYDVAQNVWEKVAVFPGCVNNEKYSGFAHGDKLYIGSFGSCSSTLYYYEEP